VPDDGPNPFAALAYAAPYELETTQPGRAQRALWRRRHWSSERILIAMALLAAAIGAAAVAALEASAKASTSPLDGRTFTTAFPAGWTLTETQPSAGVTSYTLSSNGVSVNGVGIPPAGSSAITIEEYSIALAADPAAVPQSPLTLLPEVIGTPKSAIGEASTVAVHETNLGGAPAAAASYTYTYDGVGNVQSDVVSRDGPEIATIELDTEPALASQATAALDAVIAHWHWTNQGSTQSAAPHIVYPTVLQTGFLRGCERDAGAAQCACELGYIEQRVPLATFTTYARMIAEAQRPAAPWALGAEQACVDAGPNALSVTGGSVAPSG
jgi:hypothetical protein